MSLFRARKWWETSCGGGAEEFVAGCLAVGNVDNEDESSGGGGGEHAPSSLDKVVTGSLHGVLRIHKPTARDPTPDDLLLEQNLGAPVLGVAVGRFVAHAGMRGKLALAVLHPRALVVYRVAAMAGQVQQGAYHSLERMHAHPLERTAASMTCGPFGGVAGRDLLCVLSMDGMLSVFEHESHVFSRFLSGFVVPGPLCYVPRTDCFVVANSQLQVECFRYSNLASEQPTQQQAPTTSLPDGPEAVQQATASSGKAAAMMVSSQRRLQPEWVANLGEHPQEIFVARFSRSLTSSQSDIVVLGERTLFCLKETGAIRMQKRFEFNPACAVAY
jgi:Bardet-Biedl syndrome 9 protein